MGRVWLHTCTLDSPPALANYRARGFRVYRSETRPRTFPETTPGPWPGAQRPPPEVAVSTTEYAQALKGGDRMPNAAGARTVARRTALGAVPGRATRAARLRYRGRFARTGPGHQPAPRSPAGCTTT